MYSGNHPTKEWANLDLLFRNCERQLTEVLVGAPFGTSDHRSTSFKIVGTGLVHNLVLNWSKVNFDGIRQELAKDD